MTNSREDTFVTLTDSDTSDMPTIPPKMTTIVTIPDVPTKQRKTITAKCILTYVICLILLCAAYAGAYVNFSMHLFTLELEHEAEINELEDQRNVMWRLFMTERTKLRRLADHIENFDVIFDQVE